VAGSSIDPRIERIRAAVDIVELISSHVPLKRAGSRFVGLCPFHNEKSPSFNVNPAMQIFKCFGCGAAGDIFSFLMKREGMTFPDAARTLAERAGIPWEDHRHQRKPGEPAKLDLYKVNDWAAGVFARWLKTRDDCAEARAYIKRRGINDESIQRFKLGAAPDQWDALLRELERPGLAAGITLELLAAAGLVAPRPNGNGHYDRFRNRLLFPIVDPLNRCLGFGGRALGDDPAKYLNTSETPIFNKGRGVFGLNLARDGIQKADGRVVVVEGYMDCLMPHQFGVTNVVAALGTAFTPDQVRLLKRYAQELILVFDSDKAGENAADKALEICLVEGVSVRVAQVPSGKDPCDFVLAEGGDALRKLIDAAVPALDFKYRLASRRIGGSDTIESRRGAVDDLLKTAAIGKAFGGLDPMRRGLVVADLAKLTGIPTGDLHRRIEELGKAELGRTERPRPSSAPAAPAPKPIPLEDVKPISNARLAAERLVLGVLLRHPEYFASVCEVLVPDNFHDPALSRLAGELFDALQGEHYSLPALTADWARRDDGGELVSLAGDLYRLGEEQRNPGGSVEDAVLCIRQADRNRAVEEQLNRIKDLPAQAAPDNEEWLKLAHRLGRRGKTNNPLARPRPPSDGRSGGGLTRGSSQ